MVWMQCYWYGGGRHNILASATVGCWSVLRCDLGYQLSAVPAPVSHLQIHKLVETDRPLVIGEPGFPVIDTEYTDTG